MSEGTTTGARCRRFVHRVGVVTTLMTLAGPAPGALGDSARPGDTASTVDAVEPAVDGVRVDVVGGDAFVRLRVDAGHEVLVSGYEGEPYLRVLADGTVEENQRSPATLLNRTRYGETGDSASGVVVDAAAEPEWKVVGGGGEVAWHDHRTHYMGRDRPPTISAEGLVQQWELPLVVDGVDVIVSGSIYLRDAPGPAWWAVPVVLAGVALVLAWWFRSALSLGPVAVVAALCGLAVTITSWVAWASLPSVARAMPAASMLGLVAVLAGLAAVLVGALPWRGVLLAGSGAALVTVAWAERAVFRHAVIPGADPAWPLRVALGAALAVGLIALVLGAAAVITLPPRRLVDSGAQDGTKSARR